MHSRTAPPIRFERYVAIGDSSTEGLDDPAGDGSFRGWANRLAEQIAGAQASAGGLLYANLGVRGKKTREIADEQLARALAMRPDLVTLFAGTNDIVSRRVDLSAVAADLAAMMAAIRGSGATLLTFTMPDLAPVMPLARRLAPRLDGLNAAIRTAAAQSGALLVDFAAHPVASDPRLWSPDRLHANAAGHARIAAALADALGLPDADDSWRLALPPSDPRSAARRWRDELVWGKDYLLPWLVRHSLGRSSGDRRQPKRPELAPVAAETRRETRP
ncbi:MAG: SGNH/GDSL hydrolase family protein [Thermoanaerobaculia bacterium]|jgi:lysophospholipase L1-like esterase|nr:SGNH/GDSL hydrolase family protein [Thermoanaerobaculia bacterium]